MKNGPSPKHCVAIPATDAARPGLACRVAPAVCFSLTVSEVWPPPMVGEVAFVLCCQFALVQKGLVTEKILPKEAAVPLYLPSNPLYVVFTRCFIRIGEIRKRLGYCLFLLPP